MHLKDVTNRPEDRFPEGAEGLLLPLPNSVRFSRGSSTTNASLVRICSLSEVGIHKRKPRKRSRKKERIHTLDQEKKKILSLFLDHFLGRVLVFFLFSSFLTFFFFFYKFPPLTLMTFCLHKSMCWYMTQSKNYYI